ncbi:hypothetical protein RFI_08225 [Reticulomyxa filosa]|uniref:eIF2D winged helix domain-containing protein n=1 Tax=Reticulomyxa filosa TaxID=46433 RepID=X6NT41_RETFI|nr:hypothetical protein RFI_08225 [Reticulomyxa filosa]|eukprot:ETO28899.1 hypothetical protein RFI_08225 [Reticulomyxa filosa]
MNEKKKPASNNNAVFMEQFLATLKYGVTPKMLPIQVSVLCSKQYFYTKKPSHEITDTSVLQRSLVHSISVTRWKKLSKFIKDFNAHEKYGKLVQFKPLRKCLADPVIIDINFQSLSDQLDETDIALPEQYWSPAQLQEVIQSLQKQSKPTAKKHSGQMIIATKYRVWSESFFFCCYYYYYYYFLGCFVLF